MQGRDDAKMLRENLNKEMDKMWVDLLKSQKKFEKSLAPMVFPMLEREKRKRHGFHLSEVSTPITTEVESYSFRNSKGRPDFGMTHSSAPSSNRPSRRLNFREIKEERGPDPQVS